MTIAVIVPWRDKGDLNRRRNFEAVRENLIREVPDWRVIYTSDHRDGPFNRSAAYNAGAVRTDADVLIWHEADIVADRDALHRLAEAATKPGLHTVSTMNKLAEDGSVAEVVTMRPLRNYGHVGGPLNACSRASLEQVGRFDENLSGHGWDDNAINLAFRIACGVTPDPIGAVITHLWHPRAYAAYDRGVQSADHDPADVAAHNANRERLAAYRRAKTAEDVRALSMEAV